MGFSAGVLLLDDAAGHFGWEVSGTGVAFVGDYDDEAAYVGAKGLRLKTRPSDEAEDDNVQVVRYVPYPESGLFLLRCKIGIPDVSTVKTIDVGLVVDTGVQIVFANVRWSPNVPITEARVGAVTYDEVEGQDAGVFDGQWSVLEMQVNLVDLVYGAITLQGVRVDQSGSGVYVPGASSSRAVQVIIGIAAAGAAQAIVYVADIYCGEFIRV